MANALALNVAACGQYPYVNPYMTNGFIGAGDSIFEDGFYNGYYMGYSPMKAPVMPYGLNNMYLGGGFVPTFGAGVNSTEFAKIRNMSQEERLVYFDNIQERQEELFAKRQERLEDRNLDRQLSRIQRSNGLQESERAAKVAVETLFYVIEDNRKDEVMSCFNQLKAQIAKMPQNKKLVKGPDGKYLEKELDDKELSAKAREYYQQVTGKNLVAHINESLSGSFVQGLKNGISLGLAENEDADSLTEKVMGLKRDSTNKVVKGIGRVSGAAAVGAAVGTAIAPGIGSAIGAGVGFAYGLLSCIWD